MNTEIACIADSHLPAGASLQEEHLAAAVERINRRPPGLVIVLGDVTADGSRAAYRRARKVLAGLAAPCFFVRGNNENRRAGDRRFMESLGPRRRAFRHGAWFIALMDTSDVTAMGPELAWLRRALAGRPPGMPTVVFAHHYLEALPAADRARLLSVLDQFQVRHFVAAHQHIDRRASFGRVRQRVLACLDPDKGRASFPGYYRARLGERGLSLRFVPVVPRGSGPLAALEARLGVCQYPADGDLLPWVDLCGRLGLKFLQVRLQTAAGRPSRRSIASARRIGLRLIGHLPTMRYAEDGEWINRAEVDAAVTWVKERDCALAILHPPKLPASALRATRTSVRETALGRRVLAACRQVVRSLDGVPVAVENNSSKKASMVFGCMPAHLRWLARGLASAGEEVGFCLDIGHAQASVQRVTIARWFQSLRGRMRALHLHLGDPETRETHRAIATPFSWSNNWYGVSAWAARDRAAAPLLLEMRTIEDTAASVETLRALWREADRMRGG